MPACSGNKYDLFVEVRHEANLNGGSAELNHFCVRPADPDQFVKPNLDLPASLTLRNGDRAGHVCVNRAVVRVTAGSAEDVLVSLAVAEDGAV